MAKKVTDTKVLSAVAKHFDKFHESEDFGVVLNNFTSICELLEISPTHYVNFFPDLKVKAGCLVIIFCLYSNVIRVDFFLFSAGYFASW